jgi:hypothetical protein
MNTSRRNKQTNKQRENKDEGKNIRTKTNKSRKKIKADSS